MKKTDNSILWAILGGFLGIFAGLLDLAKEYQKK